MVQDTAPAVQCYHCGEDCDSQPISAGDHYFCCQGCKTVYELIQKNNLCSYYELEANPGINQRQAVREGKFDFLDDEAISGKLVHFQDGSRSHVTFYLPQMHCSSCIWLLENLAKLEAGVIKSEVNFVRKEVTVVFDTKETSLKQVAVSLTRIGYEPHISLNDTDASRIKKTDTRRIVKLGIAGFCFGNIMMLSFPEYFSFGRVEDPSLKQWFSYLNLALSLPVFFYSASEFFVSGYKGLRQKFLNIDAPIALAILITFVRSVYEILSHTGAGYLDSMSGIVFFMLVGRYFQSRTYQSLSFDRDFKSYFPLGVVTLGEDGSERQVSVSALRQGDRIRIHNDEIVPADSILFLGKATIDYSFVTGESAPIEKSIGEIVYAGGRQTSGAIELEVVKEVSQSYLTQLWNHDVFKDEKDGTEASFIHRISRYFSYVLFSIAIATAIYWSFQDPSRVWGAVTAVLIVACPCALLLSATFTNGNMIRILNKYRLYVKSPAVIENMAAIDTIVFDKTGTMTEQSRSEIYYEGRLLLPDELQLIRSLAGQSGHPLSRNITAFLPFSKNLPVKSYREQKGAGASGVVAGHQVMLGSAFFVDGRPGATASEGSRVYVQIDGVVAGCFVVKSKYRKDLRAIVQSLGTAFELKVLSGDNDSEASYLTSVFGSVTPMLFGQKPEDKLNVIKSLQQQGKKVLMIGDGLNDAGALKQSNVGIAVSDNTNNFSPACDAILAGTSFSLLRELIRYARRQKQIIYASFILSILYNLAGLYVAVQGDLIPVVAAILMPLSSLSIVGLTTGLSSLFEIPLKKTQNLIQITPANDGSHAASHPG